MLKKQMVKDKPLAKVTFTLAKTALATAKEVRVVGDFNNWEWAKAPIMKASGKDLKATIELAAGKDYQFRYMGDDGLWENDWAADAYLPSPLDNVDNSVITIPAVKKKATAKKVTTTVDKVKAKPIIATKKVALKDDLKKIEGIGVKIAELLNEADIHTFADLAKASVDNLNEVLKEAGKRFQMHNPKTWGTQAKLAAKGEWEKLKQWQSELKGGK